MSEHECYHLEKSRAYFTEDHVNVLHVSSGLDPGFLLVNRKLMLVQVANSKSCP